MKKDTIITIAISVGFAILLFGAGYFYISGTGSSNVPLTIETVASTTKKFQSLAEQLSPLKFDTDIFSDPRFMALKNISAPFVEVPTGRTDPFAPF